LPYDPIKDITPITNVVATIGAIIAHPLFPANNVAELLAMAKAKPGAVSYASPGMGTIVHLGAEHLAQLAGIKMTHVPYKGAAPALADVLAGVIPVSFDASLSSAAPNVKAGKVKLLGVTGPTRSPLFPNAGTVAEAGFPGYDASAWFGLIGPGNLPRDIVMRLNQVTVKGLREKETVDRLATIGADVIADTPEQFAKQIRDDIAKWAPVVKSSGAKLE
ncbi:MAG: tripartite tricarboxylate transporter substrate-binding protein, partial [Burkholderiales bacterium]